MISIPAIYKGFFRYQEKQVMKPYDGKVKLDNSVEQIVSKLIELNGKRVLDAIDSGISDEESLLALLSDWEHLTPDKKLTVSFVGLRITTSCNVVGKDKCVYCDQKFVSERLSLQDIQAFVDDIYQKAENPHFYASISGGEPLLWGKKLYGKSGLIRYLADHGTYVNMNSDLQLVNTDNSMEIVQSGLSSLRFSFDISDEVLFEEITAPGAFRRTLFGMFLLSRCKQLCESYEPKMFINVVATKINITHYEDLTKFLISFCQENLKQENSEFIRSLCNIHLIPLGGEKNKHLLPSYEDWDKFVSVTIPNCIDLWNDYFAKMGTSNHMFKYFSFANPLNKDMYTGDIKEVINDFTEQKYNRHAKRLKCYTAPTQIYVLPNGDAYPCTQHAENQTHPLGNILTDSFETIIKNNLHYLNCLPNEMCQKCPLSAVKLNVKIEEGLKAYIQEHI